MQSQPKLIRVGKSSKDILRHKQSFFDDNDRMLNTNKQQAELYAKGRQRTHCKNCESKLGAPVFVKLGVGYSICGVCGHLNGRHEDDDTFCSAIYTQDGGQSYATDYRSDPDLYLQRVSDIYLPKAKFMAEVLSAHGCDPHAQTYCDFGAGSGYFLAALKQMGLSQIAGYEVSQAQVTLAHEMIPDLPLYVHAMEDINKIARDCRATVVSMIGVLEHLQDPRGMLKALQQNKNIRYVYLSLPLFSLSVFIELVFPHVMQRHLSGSHTHLYTESSINHFCREYGLRSIGEWWFGTDIMDFFRSMVITLGKSEATAADICSALMGDAVDDLQLALDHRRLSSEVHILLAFDRT